MNFLSHKPFSISTYSVRLGSKQHDSPQIGFFPITIEYHLIYLIFLYSILHRIRTTKVDVEATIYLLLGLWLFSRLWDHSVAF